MSINSLLTVGTVPIGSTFVGVISESFAVPNALLACAALSVAGAAVGYLVRWRWQREPAAATGSNVGVLVQEGD
jgi:hypothetical protein